MPKPRCLAAEELPGGTFPTYRFTFWLDPQRVQGKGDPQPGQPDPEWVVVYEYGSAPPTAAGEPFAPGELLQMAQEQAATEVALRAEPKPLSLPGVQPLSGG